jgi:flagellar basal-body rod modification protein FlgD
MATAISSTQAPAAPTATKQSDPLTQGAGGALGKDQFLKLLVAQMKNQDPLNPMDGTQMASQLAQFSSVEQLQAMNTTLTAQQTGQSNLEQRLSENGALASVGKSVVASAASIDTTGGAPSTILADIPADAKSGILHVYDDKGVEVATQDLGFVTPGRQSFSLKSTVTSLPGAIYHYDVETTGASNEAARAATYIAGRVDGVRYTAQGPLITIGGSAVPYLGVTSVTN